MHYAFLSNENARLTGSSFIEVEGWNKRPRRSAISAAREEKMRHFAKAAAAALAVSLIATAGSATEFPERPITWVVPFSAGGGADTWTRIIASKAEEHFGQSFIVQNMPGSGGILGWQHILQQPADGYTVIHGSPTPIITLVMDDDPIFQPSEIRMVGYLGTYETILAAREGQPWSDWDSFVEYTSANPGQLTVAGTDAPLLSVASILDQAGIDVILVPYQGTSDAVTDFLGGHVELLAGTTTSIAQLTPNGVVGVLNASDQDLAETAQEAFGDAVPPTATTLGFRASANPRWVGVHPDTPDDIVQAISDRLGLLMNDPEILAAIAQTGEEAVFTPAAEAQERFESLVEQMRASAAILRN